MKKLRLFAVAAIAAVFMMLSSGPAQAYPDCGVSLTLSRSTLVGGGTFDFTADAGDVDGAFTVTYDGMTKTGSGSSFSDSFKTRVVSKKFTSKITAILETETQTCTASVNVTLLPKGAIRGDNGALPDTGGSHRWILVLGGALLVGGAGVIIVSRRRSTH